MEIFKNFLDKIRDILDPETKIVDRNGDEITDENIIKLKKSELVDYIDLLESDKKQQKEVLNNLDSLKKSFSEDLYNDAETTTLTKIRGIDNEIVKAKKELRKLKDKFSDAIVYNNKGEILFLRRKNDSSKFPGLLGLPGGHIDLKEDAETAAKRELLEETNLEAHKATLLGELKNKDVEISYFMIEVKEKDLIILEADEHINLEWKSLDDLEEDNLIPGLKDKLEEMLNPYKHSVKVLKKAFELGKISEERYLEVLSKAKGPAQIGEIREWSGQKMKKEATGWVPVTGEKKGDKEDGKKGPVGKKDDSKKKQPGGQKPGVEGPTPEQLSAHAKETSTEDLQTTAEDKNADPSLVEAANAELAERGEEPSVKQRLKEKAKDWHKKQVEFYQSGALDANSEDRKGLSGFLAKKKDGIIKAVKDEVKEFKEAGSGLKKFFTGNKGDITDHEKKAMKTLAIHLGVVVGSMALTGGLSGLATKGVAALGKGVVMHYFEHAGMMRLGHVLAFAKAESDMSEEEFEKYLGQLIDKILEHIESGDIPEEDWMSIGDDSKDDFAMLAEEEDEERDPEEKKEKASKKEEKKDK